MSPLAAGWLGGLVLASIVAGAVSVFTTHPLRSRDLDTASQAAAQVSASAMALGMVVSAGLVSQQIAPAGLAVLAAVSVATALGAAWHYRDALPEDLARWLATVGVTRLGLAFAPVPTPVRVAALLGGGGALSIALDLHRHRRLVHGVSLATLLVDIGLGWSAAQSWPDAWWPLWLVPLWAVAHGVGAIRAG